MIDRSGRIARAIVRGDAMTRRAVCAGIVTGLVLAAGAAAHASDRATFQVAITVTGACTIHHPPREENGQVPVVECTPSQPYRIETRPARALAAAGDLLQGPVALPAPHATHAVGNPAYGVVVF